MNVGPAHNLGSLITR
jgi:hypothetical protein